jgi:translation initiation factor 2 alpha subunit (eIF-2alpha)
MERTEASKRRVQQEDKVTKDYSWERVPAKDHLLLDISEESGEPFDELLIERSAKSVWLHFAVRPSENRRKVDFLKK